MLMNNERLTLLPSIWRNLHVQSWHTRRTCHSPPTPQTVPHLQLLNLPDLLLQLLFVGALRREPLALAEGHGKVAGRGEHLLQGASRGKGGGARILRHLSQRSMVRPCLDMAFSWSTDLTIPEHDQRGQYPFQDLRAGRFHEATGPCGSMRFGKDGRRVPSLSVDHFKHGGPGVVVQKLTTQNPCRFDGSWSCIGLGQKGSAFAK